MPREYHISLGAEEGSVLSSFMADRTHEVTAIMGPLGSGKTMGLLQRLLAHTMEQAPTAEGVRPTRIAVIRNTYPDLEGTTIKDFLSIFIDKEMGVMKWSVPPTFHGNFWLRDGTNCKPEFVFMALDREDHVKKLRGTQFTGFWLNEIKELIKPVFDMVTGRYGRYPKEEFQGVDCTWGGVLGDTNACDDDHWYFDVAENIQPEQWKFYRQPGGVVRTGRKNAMGREIYELNPKAENVKNLRKGYYTTTMIAKEDAWINVNLCNEYGFYVSGKPIHPGYVDSIHCLTEQPDLSQLKELRIGIDFGRTPAAALIAFDEFSGRHTIIDEFVTQDMSAALFGPELKMYLNANYQGLPVRAWGDPAGMAKGQATESECIDVIRAAGIPIVPAPSNSPILRRAAISIPLSQNCGDGMPRLMITPKAKMIRKGLMGGFCYRKMHIVGTERYSEEPDKNLYSHPVEAAEYGLLGAGEYHKALSGTVVRTGGSLPRRARGLYS